jgi:hypothetical protein
MKLTSLVDAWILRSIVAVEIRPILHQCST